MCDAVRWWRVARFRPAVSPAPKPTPAASQRAYRASGEVYGAASRFLGTGRWSRLAFRGSAIGTMPSAR